MSTATAPAPRGMSQPGERGRAETCQTRIVPHPRVSLGRIGHPTQAIAARRVLMICQTFPPTGGPGVQRSAKFAKFLPRFGWQPVVWAADHLDQLPGDESLAVDLPAELMRHTRPGSSYTANHRRIMCALEAWGVRRLTGEKRWAGLDWRVLRLLHGLSVRMPPDDQLAWVVRSVTPLLKLIRREKVEAIFSTYSPVANHLLGLLAKRISGLPWVADFRDLWTDDYCYAPRSRARAWADRRLEQTILRQADAVVAVTPSQTRILARHVPQQVDKFVCIANGVDAADFERLDRTQVRQALHGPANRFILTFAGRFLSDRVDDGLIAGLVRFTRESCTEDGSFQLRVVGTVSDEMIHRFTDAGVPVRATGYLPHSQALTQMIAADVLLLPAPVGRNADTLIPAKTFEYLAAGRPILLVGPREGEVQRLVQSCAAGACVESSPDAVCAALTALWHQWHGARLPEGCAPQHLAPFTRERLTERLAEVLSEARCSRSHA